MVTIKAGSGGYSVAREAGTTQKLVKVDTNKRGVSSSWNKEKVTLEEAKQQTKETEEYVSTSSQETTEAPTPEAPDPAPQVQEPVKEFADFYDTPTTERPTPQAQDPIKLTPEQSKKLNTKALNTRNEPSGSGPYLTRNYTPEEVKKASEPYNPYSLGPAESTAQKYEGAVSEITNPLINQPSQVQKVDNIVRKVTGGQVSPSTGLKVVGGIAEGVLLTPVAVPRMVKGLATDPVTTAQDTVKGTVEMAVTDPARLTGNIIGGALAGRAGVGTLKFIKAKTPAIVSASEPQGFLLKKSGVTIAKEPTIVNDVPLIEAPKGTPSPDAKVFAKPNEAGTADIYIKLNADQAGQVAQRFTGNVRNIRTPAGSFVEFEPTGIIESPKISRTGLKRLTTKTPELIGDAGKSNASKSLKSPVRLEARENIQPASIKASDIPDRLQIPDITFDMEATARPVKDPLALKSGRNSFWESEAAELLTKEKRKTVINDMPWMKEKVAGVKAEVTVKEPPRSPIDFNSEFERLYNNAGRKPQVPRQTMEASLMKNNVLPKTTNPGSVLGLGLLPRTTPGIKPNSSFKPIPQYRPTAGVTDLMGYDVTIRRTSMPRQKQNTMQTPRLDNIQLPQQPIEGRLSVPNYPGRGLSRPRTSDIYSITPPTKKGSHGKRGKKNKTSWEYDRLVNSYGDPYKFKYDLLGGN